MAEIKIKGRRETIPVSNDRAKRIKVLWRGDPDMHVSPAPRTDIIDLGTWSGELGQIASVELDRQNAANVPIDEADLSKVEKGLAEFKGKKEQRGTRYKTTVFSTDLYLESLGTIRFDEWGSIVIKDQRGWTRVKKMIEIVQERQQSKEIGVRKGLIQTAELAGKLRA